MQTPSPASNKKTAYHAVDDARRAGAISDGACITLRHLIACTALDDWREGGEPICFESVESIALARGMTDRAIRGHILEAERAGLIMRKTGANGARSAGRLDPETGRRDGRLGVLLSPALAVAARYQALSEEKARESMAIKIAAHELKAEKGLALRLLASVGDRPRSAIKAAVEAVHQQLQDLPMRYLPAGLDCLMAAVRALRAVCERLQSALGAVDNVVADRQIFSAPPENICRTYTLQPNPTPSEYCSTPVHKAASPDGDTQFAGGLSPAIRLRKSLSGDRSAFKQKNDRKTETTVPISVALAAASSNFTAAFEAADGSDWRGIVSAAGMLAPSLGVSQSLWGEACAALGRETAALCLIVADAQKTRGKLRPTGTVGGYLRGMLAKAASGDLHVGRSIWGLAT